jgi:uncharacterized protein (TIGR00730 family)
MVSDEDRTSAAADTSGLLEQALLALWSAANTLARIRPDDGRYRVTIFGSARIDAGDRLYADVRSLAERLSALGCDIVTGGGPGLMEAANEGAQLGDPDDLTRSVGIRVALPFEHGANPFVERVYTHQTFFTRLHHFVRVSNAFVVMPGGLGTTLELVMVWQLLQVRHLGEVPLILVGEMWRELVDWAGRWMVSGPTGFATAEDMALPICVGSVDEAAAVIEQHMARAQPGEPVGPR